jgi:hypothetical protein
LIVRIEKKVETALREALDSVPRVEVDQITAPLARLDDSDRTKALGLAGMIACYVAVDVCDNKWPNDAIVGQFAQHLATRGSTAKRLQLDAGQIHAYLSRAVLGPENLADVIPDEPMFTRLPVIVAQRALAVYCPKGMVMWAYLDQIESAIEVASSLNGAVIPAAVMIAYLPKATADDQKASQPS